MDFGKKLRPASRTMISPHPPGRNSRTARSLSARCFGAALLPLFLSSAVAVSNDPANHASERITSPLSEPAQLKVAADPAELVLHASEDWHATYRFSNTTAEDFRVVERTAYFHSLKTAWQSKLIGPVATGLKLSALGSAEWKDTPPALRSEVLDQARKAGALDDGQLLFVQNFTLRAASGETRHVAATIVVRTDEDPSPTERIDLPHHQVTVLRSLRTDPGKNAQLAKLLTFAEAAYGKLEGIVGFVPNGGRKIPLHITAYGGFPHYRSGKGGFLNIPCEVLESQETSEWLFVAYPHELAHYFLLEEFPNPPRWFIEGPASFFGTKVAEALGYKEMTREDRRKILGWAAEYTAQNQQYLFSETWPGDGSTPGKGYALGLGRGYALCGKLEDVCGSEIFPNLFRYLHQSRTVFSAAQSERERINLLIGAMQTQTTQDVWAVFAQEGFRP